MPATEVEVLFEEGFEFVNFPERIDLRSRSLFFSLVMIGQRVVLLLRLSRLSWSSMLLAR